MKHNTLSNLLSVAVLLSLMVLAAAMVFGAATSVEPSAPNSLSIQSNTTTAYPNGTVLNGTRGYIYNVELNESQPTFKWVGYVGNINGEYALVDSSGKALYDWNIATVTGEVYATKEGPYISAATYDDVSPYHGGIPYWPNITCVNSTIITGEGGAFNHTSTDEDSYTNTFKDTGFTNPGFFTSEVEVTNTNVIEGSAGNCYGANLNTNNTDESENGNWTQVILTDRTIQYRSAVLDVWRYDVIYASIIENDSIGYNGNNFDFQFLLPQSGLEGNQPNVAYYFYVELI